jgi:hypothetical protein
MRRGTLTTSFTTVFVVDRTRPDGRVQTPLVHSPPKLNPLKQQNATINISTFLIIESPYLVIVSKTKIYNRK